LEIVRQFLPLVNVQDRDGMTMLHCAALYNEDCNALKEMLDVQGVNVNLADKEGHTALQYAIAHKGAKKYPAKVEMVKLLLAAGANKHLKDKNGKIPLDWAESTQHHEMIKLLTEPRPQPEHKVEDGRTLSLSEAENAHTSRGRGGDDPESVQRLVEGASFGNEQEKELNA
jgi:ankyrin repeat protein